MISACACLTGTLALIYALGLGMNNNRSFWCLAMFLAVHHCTLPRRWDTFDDIITNAMTTLSYNSALTTINEIFHLKFCEKYDHILQSIWINRDKSECNFRPCCQWHLLRAGTLFDLCGPTGQGYRFVGKMVPQAFISVYWGVLNVSLVQGGSPLLAVYGQCIGHEKCQSVNMLWMYRYFCVS